MNSTHPNRRTLIAAATLAMATLAFTAAPAFAQETVKIGYSGPLSGGAAQYGKNALDGIKMAIDEINADGLEVAGKKVKLEVVAYDDKYNPSETAINAQRLVQESKVPAILVPHSGGIYALQTNNEAQKYLVLAYSSTPQITARGNKLTMRIPPDFTTYIAPFINYTTGKFGKNVAIADADHDYAKAWNAEFKPALEKAGGKVVADNPMSYTRATDFYSGVSRVLAAKPDVLFIGGPSEPTGLVVKQARELGFKGGFILIDQAKLDEVAKVSGGYKSLEGSIGVLPVEEDSAPESKAFVERFHKIYPGRPTTSETSLNYSAIWALAHAMKLAGTVSDSVAIRGKLDEAFKTMPKAQNMFGVEGVDATGSSVADGRVAVVEGGKIREAKMSTLK